MTWIAIVGSVVALALNAGFVAAEFGVLGARRHLIDSMAAQGNRSARAAQHLQLDVLAALGGAQLGITVCSLVLGKVGEPAIAHTIEPLLERFVEVSDTVLHSVSFTVSLGIVVVVHMVLGEMVPKNLALAGPDRVLLFLARPMWAFVRIARPVNQLMNMIANGILKLVRVEPASELIEVASPAEFGLMVRESHREGLIDAEERALIEGALRFGDTTAQQVMAPMADVDAVTTTDPVGVVERRLDETNHSRLVVVGSGVDDVRGFVHSKDLLTVDLQGRELALSPLLIRPMLKVLPTAPLPEVLQLMRRARIHMGLVTDGRVNMGVLTLDDVLRELVGSLVDAESEMGDDA